MLPWVVVHGALPVEEHTTPGGLHFDFRVSEFI